MDRLTDQAIAEINALPTVETYGRVTKILGLLVEIAGFGNALSIGSIVHLKPNDTTIIPCETVGFKDNHALLMPFGTLDGIGLGCKAVILDKPPTIMPTDQWLGRVINALGEPIDGKGPLIPGTTAIPQGQRMGIFSGSGVGKSVLLSMMARYTAADVSIIGLVGERGREVQEFLEDDLGEEGLKRSIVVVATGDEAALMRRQAAYLTLSLSEYFRDQGQQVLCLIDSVTRFAMAQREIGLSAGEPPSELARLLERAGPGKVGYGSITGLFSVLVEGDDHNEPISDAVRGIVDGHIVMDRSIADRGRYPAIDVLRSISRSMPKALTEDQNAIIKRAKQIITTYEDMAELIRLGAYRKGTDPAVDEALDIYPKLEEFLTQNKDDNTTINDGFEILAGIVGL